MAYLRKVVFLFILLIGLWASTSESKTNPEADPACNGVGFHNCTETMDDFANCHPNSSWLQCAKRQQRDIKLMDCNDHQREQAKRLVEIFTTVEEKMCSSTSDLFAGVKDKQQCWSDIQNGLVSGLFGHGTMPCKISKFAQENGLNAIKASCNAKVAEKHYFDIWKVADCTDAAPGTIAGNVWLMAPLLLTALTTSLAFGR